MSIRAFILTFTIALFMALPLKVLSADLYSVRYVDCYDGDTCTFIAPYLHEAYRNIPLRFLGVDTPEIRGACPREEALAIRARDAVREWLKSANHIDLLDIEARTVYGRDVALVVIDGGVSIQDLLLENELAVRSEGKKRTHNWCGTGDVHG